MSERRKRVLMAKLSHETNTFVKVRTQLSQFQIREGVEFFEIEGNGSTSAGALEIARECCWEVVPAIEMSATPSGMVSDEAIELFWDSVRNAYNIAQRTNGIDGVFFDLHGAMVSDSFPDVEGEILERTRLLVGASMPIVAVLDFHGNISDKMARNANGFIAYRENPHKDAQQAAKNAAKLLDRLLTTHERAQTAHLHIPVVWSPPGVGTLNEPMKTLERMAREIEANHPEILVVNVFGGFSFADIPDTGVSFSAVTVGDPKKAMNLLAPLSDYAIANKELGCPVGISVAEAISKLKTRSEGPILLVEPAENIGAGAPGNVTIILKALLDNEINRAGVALCDPDAVARLWDIPIGETTAMDIGGDCGAEDGRPLSLRVELVSKSDGCYTLEDPISHSAGYGLNQTMGRCAVVKCKGVTILLTSLRTPPTDLAQWRSQGVQPEDFFVINIKAAVAHGQAYDPIAKASYTLSSPGCCDNDLTRLPYKNIARPIFPLDKI